MSEIRGIGMDLCGIARMEKLMDRESFLRRVFTEQELQYVRSRGKMASASLAAIWAAKEAVFKAMGKGICTSMQEVEILHRESGQPYCVLHGEAKKLGQGTMLISITHEGDMAAAMCVWSFSEPVQESEDTGFISGAGVAGTGAAD